MNVLKKYPKSELEKLNPELASSLYKLRKASVVFATVIIAGFAYLFSVAISQSQHIKTIEQQSPCYRSIYDVKCRQVRNELAIKGELRTLCIYYQRVTNEIGPNCPRFYVDRQLFGKPPLEAFPHATK